MGKAVLAEILGFSPPPCVVYSCLLEGSLPSPRALQEPLLPIPPFQWESTPWCESGKGGEVVGEGADS